MRRSEVNAACALFAEALLEKHNMLSFTITSKGVMFTVYSISDIKSLSLARPSLLLSHTQSVSSSNCIFSFGARSRILMHLHAGARVRWACDMRRRRAVFRFVFLQLVWTHVSGFLVLKWCSGLQTNKTVNKKLRLKYVYITEFG